MGISKGYHKLVVEPHQSARRARHASRTVPDKQRTVTKPLLRCRRSAEATSLSSPKQERAECNINVRRHSFTQTRQALKKKNPLMISLKSHHVRVEGTQVRHWLKQAAPSFRRFVSRALLGALNEGHLVVVDDDGQVGPVLYGERVHPRVKQIWTHGCRKARGYSVEHPGGGWGVLWWLFVLFVFDREFLPTRCTGGAVGRVAFSMIQYLSRSVSTSNQPRLPLL